MVNCFLTDEYILSFKLEKCIACFPFFKNETVTWSLIDNNCVITRISPCALDVLMAGALCQDQLLLLCPCPCTPCSSQAVSIPVLPIWHSCWASGILGQWLGSSDGMQKPGGTGLQKADDELCNCPFQAGMSWWARNAAGDGNMQEVPTSFLLCPLWNIIAFGSNSKAQQSFGFAFGVCYLDIWAISLFFGWFFWGVGGGFCVFWFLMLSWFFFSYNDWMTSDLQKITGNTLSSL